MHGIVENTNFYCFGSTDLLVSNYLTIASIIGGSTNTSQITVCFDSIFGGGKRSISLTDVNSDKSSADYTYENKPKLLRRDQNNEIKQCMLQDDQNFQTGCVDDVIISPNKSISLLFSNVRGLRSKDKIIALRHVSKNDSIICLNETNYTIKDKPKVIEDQLGKTVEISSMNNYSFDKSGRLVLSRDRDDIVGTHYRGRKKKTSGYGTCAISKEEKLIDYLEKNDKFEIIVSTIKHKHIKGLLITVYRSPSMTSKVSNDDFLIKLRHLSGNMVVINIMTLLFM